MHGYHSGLDARGDPTRRAIVEALRGGPVVAVGRIVDGVPVSWPAVSRHLLVLAEAGLVRVQSVGSRNFYALDPDGLEVIRAYFDAM